MLLVHRVRDKRFQFTISFSWIRQNMIVGLFCLVRKYFAEGRVFACLSL